MTESLPLYALFLELRNEGFSLGTEQYLLLIRALHRQNNLVDLAALRRMGQIIWTNSQEEIWIFNRHFDLMIRGMEKVIKEVEEVVRKEKEKQSSGEGKKYPEEEKKKPGGESSPGVSENITASTSDIPPMDHTKPSGSAITALPGAFAPMGDSSHEHFLMQTDVSPITLRQMQQSWRYLRRWRRRGAETELDLDKTIEAVARRGFFLQPERSAPRVNAIDLLLLVDRNGSMAPFHGLLNNLVDSALNGGRFQKVRCLYFHDYPIQYLYRNPQLTNELEMEKLGELLDRKHSVAMIISDAGAARQTYSSKRIDRTRDFCQYLQQYTTRTVWLNPMPKERWAGCTAEDVCEFIQMFEISHLGLNQAIDVLRGKGSKE